MIEQRTQPAHTLAATSGQARRVEDRNSFDVEELSMGLLNLLVRMIARFVDGQRIVLLCRHRRLPPHCLPVEMMVTVVLFGWCTAMAIIPAC